jgi:hypothetical protein
MRTFFSAGGMTLSSLALLRVGSSVIASFMMARAVWIWASVTTKGGVRRMMLEWVGLAYFMGGGRLAY